MGQVLSGLVGWADTSKASESNEPHVPSTDESPGIAASRGHQLAVRTRQNGIADGFGTGHSEELIESGERPSLPPEIVLEIAKQLLRNGERSAVCRFMRVSSEFYALILPVFMRSFSTQTICRRGRKEERLSQLKRFYDTIWENPERFRYIRELALDLNVQGAVDLIELCPNVQNLTLLGETDFLDLIKAPCFSRLEYLKLDLKHNKEHNEIQLGFARRHLRMPNLVELDLRSTLMPRFLNALVDNTPNLQWFTLNIHSLDDEDRPHQLSDRLVGLVTHFIIESGDGSVPALCLANFASRKTEQDISLFQPHHIVVNWWSTGTSADESNIWPALLEVQVPSLVIEYCRSSYLAQGLPKGLRRLKIGYLTLEMGQQREELERVVGTFVGRKKTKLTIDRIYTQNRDRVNDLHDDDWIAEMDYWVATLGHEIRVEEHLW
jgi:hypothetical protein